jgi:surfeit locus 1 family protein
VKSHRALKKGAMAGALLLLTAGFVALGIWQIERRAWKHALIAAVESRVHRPPTAPPPPADWADVSAARDAYARVGVTGRYLPERDTLVLAVSDLGSGYWVMTPFRTANFTLLINRGFVPQGTRAPAPPQGTQTVTGLLRITEPGGGFLRSNDPAAGRWYSRDVAAIAQARRVGPVAPYFIDADKRGDGYPVGGLTVIRFSDNHMSYALTWFGMALLSLVGLWLLLKERGRAPNRDRL